MIDQNILTALQTEATQQAAFASEYQNLAEEHAANAARLEEALKLIAVAPISSQKLTLPIAKPALNSDLLPISATSSKSHKSKLTSWCSYKKPEYAKMSYVFAAKTILEQHPKGLNLDQIANKMFVDGLNPKPWNLLNSLKYSLSSYTGNVYIRKAKKSKIYYLK